MVRSQPSMAAKSKTPSQRIDARIKALGDWRGDTLARVRALIRQAHFKALIRAAVAHNQSNARSRK